MESIEKNLELSEKDEKDLIKAIEDFKASSKY
jgi:F-type H+-transporting ATPase subunit alpha